MKRMVFAIVAVIALSGFTTRSYARTHTLPALSAADESAVRALVSQFADSWNRHDMKAMRELDTEDVEWINVVGHYWRGKDTVYKGHTAIHKGMSAKTTAEVESATVRSIAPNVAMAVATMHWSSARASGRLCTFKTRRSPLSRNMMISPRFPRRVFRRPLNSQNLILSTLRALQA
jgi:uncharacterized protein (TIGR02246 family)